MEDNSSRDETKDIAIDEVESENSSAGSQSDEPQVTKPKTSRFAHLENINFNFEAYDQDICILGSKGSGKSFLANTIMKSLNGISVWCYDFNFQFHSSRAIVVHEMDELLEMYDKAKRGHWIFQPHNNSENTFRRFCAEGFKSPNNVLTNSKHVFAFKLNLESDVKFLEGFLGSDVWVLLPPDKRHKLRDEPQLEEHTFFYRDMDTHEGAIGKV